VSIWRSVRSAPPLTEKIEDVLWDWAQEGAIPDLALFEEVLRQDAASVKGQGKGLNMGILRSRYTDELESGKLTPEQQEDPDYTVNEDGKVCYMGVPLSEIGPQNLAADLEEDHAGDGTAGCEPEVSAA